MIPTFGCALANLLADVDPIGSAAPFDQLFLLQVPPPWPRIALDSPAAPPGLRRALAAVKRAAPGVHVMFIDGAEPAPADGVRVLHFVRPDGLVNAYRQSEHVVPFERVGAWLVERGSAAGAAATRHAPGSHGDAEQAGAGGGVRHLLVCTHGERDGCCGRFGEAAFDYLAGGHASRDLKVWRVSHFGGHRFAPTMLDMPSGRCWGNLSPAACDAIARHAGDVASLRGNYRGWCALPAAAQVAERELFEEHAWRWLDAEVAAEAGELGGAGLRLSLEYRLPGRPEERREAVLDVVGESLAPVTCGARPTPTTHYACRWTGGAEEAADGADGGRWLGSTDEAGAAA